MSALVFNTRRPLFADQPRAPGADQAVRFRMDQPHALSWPICAHRKLLRALGALLAWARRRRAGEGAARALLERGQAKDHGRHLRLPGQRRVRRKPRGTQRGAGAARSRQATGWRTASCATRPARPFSFEILATTRAEERLLLTYARALQEVGIEARIRQVDSAQYQRRKQTYDFDMIQYDWPVSLSPGNEQSFRWGSDAAATEGTYNYAGVKSAGVDAMIKALLEAKDSEGFVAAVRALDRLLLSGDYVVPLFHLPTQWLAYWNRLKRPADTPIYGYQIDTWWAGPSRWATAPAVAHAEKASVGKLRFAHLTPPSSPGRRCRPGGGEDRGCRQAAPLASPNRRSRSGDGLAEASRRSPPRG